MDVVKQASETYVANENEIARRKRIIERHENKIEKIRAKNWWGDVILRPIMSAVESRFSYISWDSDRFVPMGLRNAVSVFGKYKDKTIMLRFTPSKNGFVNLDIKPEYSTHGFGSKTEIVDNINVIYDYIEQKIIEKDFVD